MEEGQDGYGSAKVKSTGQVGRILRFDPGDANMTFKVELPDHPDWFPLDAIEVTSGRLVGAVEKMRRAFQARSDQEKASGEEDNWTVNLGEQISKRRGLKLLFKNDIVVHFFDCRYSPQMVLTMGKVLVADDVSIGFTNLAGDEVLRIPYRRQQQTSEVLVSVSEVVGVPPSGIHLIRTDGRLVHCPDNASMELTLEEEGPMSSFEPMLSTLAFVKEKAAKVLAGKYGVGVERPQTQWRCSNEGHLLWERLKTENVSLELNMCLGLDPDSPVEVEQSLTTECQWDQYRSSCAWLHSLFLSNETVVLLIESMRLGCDRS